jgi:hypothetical protein
MKTTHPLPAGFQVPEIMRPPVHRRYNAAPEEIRRADRFHRQMLHSVGAYGFFAHLFYLEEDDSFILRWRLPDSGFGEKAYTNPDDCFYSFCHCQQAIQNYAAPLSMPDMSAVPA